jgi:hypothetical protein
MGTFVMVNDLVINSSHARQTLVPSVSICCARPSASRVSNNVGRPFFQPPLPLKRASIWVSVSGVARFQSSNPPAAPVEHAQTATD